jgi:hypothetical protein
LFSSAIAPALQAAFLETEFRVLGPRPFTLWVGEASTALAEAHRQHAVACSAYLTAHNPWSETLPDSENDARQTGLLRGLAQEGLHFVEGIGQHPSNGWPGEASLLIFGLSLVAAKALGQRWEQNAIVWSGADAVPRLILLR